MAPMGQACPRMRSFHARHTVSSISTIIQLALLTLLALSRATAAQESSLQYLLRTPGVWPPYTRGRDNHQWVLSKRALRNGVSYLGSHQRLRVAVAKMKSGQPTVVSTIGGSITAGQGCVDGHAWPYYLHNYLTDTYGDHVKLANGAVPGCMSSYFSVCSQLHVPIKADVIFVELTQNDVPVVYPSFLNPHRRHYERLIRKLMNMPNHPAVVLVHTYSWLMHKGVFWGSAEGEIAEFARYYQLPSVSLKSCCYHILAEGPVGFQVNPTRNTNRTLYQDKSFYYDLIHPDGRTGARVISELAMHLMDSIAAELTAEPLTHDDSSMAALPLPKPMIPDNYESQHECCYLARQFTSSITKKDGFAWVNEAVTGQPKWGMVATQVGSVLEATFSSQASSRPHDPQAQQQSSPAAAEVLVELAYLQSYEHMGRASVSCVGGCTCKPVILEGNTTQRSSQLTLLPLYVTQHHQCVIQVKVLAESSSGEHKVKIVGIMISEEPGKVEGIRNSGAVHQVHDTITNSESTTFDIARGRLLHTMLSWAAAYGHGAVPELSG